MKSVLLKLLPFALIPIIIGFINYTIDPHLITNGSGLEQEISAKNLKGSRVRTEGGFNTRILRREFMTQASEPRDLAILGSSNLIELGARHLDSVSLYNYSVPNASVQDYLALYHSYLESNGKCKTIMIDVNPFSYLEKTITQPWWLANRKEYLGGLRDIKKYNIQASLQSRSDQIKQLLSIAHFKESLRQLSAGDEAKSTRKRPIFMFPDGSWNKMSVNDSIRRSAGQSTLNDNTYDPVSTIDEKKLEVLLALIEHAKTTHQKVFLLLPPQAPFFHKKIPPGGGVRELELFLREKASERDFEIIGSFDPDLLSLTDKDFIDVMHWQPKVMQQYLKSIRFSERVLEYGEK